MKNEKSVNVCDWFILLLALILLPASAAHSRAANTCDGIELPIDIRRHIEQESSQWKVINVSDLDLKYRTFWLSKYSGDCPGIAIGHFKPSSRTLYAVALVSRTLNAHVKILVFEYKSNKYRSTVLMDTMSANPVPTIFKVPPETFEDWETGVNVKSRFPGVALAFYEGSSTLFYWSNGKFKELQISD